MDTTKLVKAIQIIVKEEVKKEMAKREKVIRESILKEMKSSAPKTKMVNNDPLVVDHIFESSQQTKQTFTNKSLLNDMLNETAQGGEWRSINGQGGMFNASQAQAWGGGVNTQNATFQTAEGGQVSAQQLQQTEAGQAVVNAVTRDYSQLMKAIDKKKGK